MNKKFFVISERLLLMAGILVAGMYLIFCAGSALEVSEFLKPFVYISFALSLIVYLISMIGNVKKWAQKNKPFTLILSVFLSFLYARVRVSLFPSIFQFEDGGTAIIIMLSFLAVLFGKGEVVGA